MKTNFFQLDNANLKSALRPWVITATVALTAGLVVIPPPDGLSESGLHAIAIFILCVIFWVTNAIPLMVTSLLAIVLLPLLGVLESHEAYALFGNQAVFFILGAFILASAVMRSGLSTRIALLLLEKFGGSHRRLLLGVLLLPAALSCVMSEHAVAAMFFPIILAIADRITGAGAKQYRGALFFAMSWGAIIGGIVTFLGGARALLAVGILEETTGQTIGFLNWALAALPIALAMLVFAAALLLFWIRGSNVSIDSAINELHLEVTEMGPVSRREWALGLLMLCTIGLWMTVGHEMGLANIAVLAVVVAFFFKLLKWSEVQDDVNWGIILLYGGAIGLGVAMSQSGATEWVLDVLLQHVSLSSAVLILVLGVAAIFLTEAVSNTAVVALLMPLALALALEAGIDPAVVALALAIPSGLAFMLPMSTPATAIALSSKHITVSETMRTGILLNIAAIIFFLLTAIFYWPIVGFSLY